MYHTVHKLIVRSHANILMSESESPGRPFSSAPDTVVTEWTWKYTVIHNKITIYNRYNNS